MLFRKNIFFKDADVADLAWAIGSPPMLKEEASEGRYTILQEDWFDAQFDKHRDWLRELDNNPESLKGWLAKDGQKLLGKRFESLLAFWFTHSEYFELLFRNVVFHHAKNTSGEIDFLIREKETGELWHIESACKYYLGEHKAANWKNWIGPNGHDTLQLKMNKLKNQIRTFQRQEGLHFLKEHKLDKPKEVFLLKGYFFHHYRRIAGSVAPLHAHPHYNSGWYLYENELPLFAGDLAQWLLLPKEKWIGADVYYGDELSILSGNEMIEQCRSFIRKHAKAPMIVQVEERDGATVGVARGFVVRDAWPHF